VKIPLSCEESFEKNKQRIMRESKRVEKTKKEIDSQRAEIDATQKKHEKQMKKLKRTKEECERAQNAFLLKVQPWQKKLVKIRKLKENVRKETLDARLQYENEFEEKLAKWVNQWELKNEELQEREASLQKSTSSLIDREEDLKSWSSELESFQEKLNEKQEYITSCRIDEREADLKRKLEELVKEEKRFQERQEKLGEWEKTQIAKMKEYEEKITDLVEREARIDQIKEECLQKDAIRDKQMKELEEREAKFLEVVNTFTTERGKFEGERKEFHRWRRKEKRKIEDESKTSKKKMKKVESDLVELESRKEKWLESAKKEVRIDQQRMELDFLKKIKRREAQSDTKIKLREKQMEAEMKRNIKKARQELQRSSGNKNHVRLNEVEDLIMEKEAELQKLHALVEAKRFELEDVEKDVERLETMDADKIKTQVEQKLLEKQEDWELEREIERAEYEASIKHKERSLREELQIEMYANMDEERMNMEDEIRNGIAEKLRIQTEFLDEYLSEDNFSWMENQMQLLARKIQLQQVHTQLWLDQQRSGLEKQRKDLELYAAKTKLTMSNSVDTLAEKEKRLIKREKKLKEQKEELQELKRDLDRAKKDLVLMKGNTGRLAPNGVEQAYSVKTYTGGGRKNRSNVRASKSSTRKKRRNSIDSTRSANEKQTKLNITPTCEFRAYLYEAQIAEQGLCVSLNKQVIVSSAFEGVEIQYNGIVIKVEKGCRADKCGVKRGWLHDKVDDKFIYKPWVTEKVLDTVLGIQFQSNLLNKVHGITGIMVVVDNYVVQFVEGESEKVGRLIRNIGFDERIDRSTWKTLADFTTTSRFFPNWHMRFESKDSMQELVRRIFKLWKAEMGSQPSLNSKMRLSFAIMQLHNSKIFQTHIVDVNEFKSLQAEARVLGGFGREEASEHTRCCCCIS